jgi:hypothetical protein
VTVPRLAARAWPPGPQYHPVMGAVAPVSRICGREAGIGALGRVAAGGPAVVLMEGEAGIGKTRLLAEVLADAAGRGMQVAAGPVTYSDVPRMALRAISACTGAVPSVQSIGCAQYGQLCVLMRGTGHLTTE